MTDECVLVVRTARRSETVYHTGRCRAVRRMDADPMLRADPDRLPDRWRECRFCAGEALPWTTDADYGPSEAYRVAAGVDDV